MPRAKKAKGGDDDRILESDNDAMTPDSSGAARDGSDDQPGTPAETPKKTPRKRKPAPSAVYTLLPAVEGICVPVDVAYQDDDVHAKKASTGGKFDLMVKLSAAATFSLVTTTMLDGDYRGCQAIIVKPEPPFDFLGLPAEIRAMVCEQYYYAANDIEQTGKIIVNKTKNGPRAVDFNGVTKNRNALMTVNREIFEEAKRILYKRRFVFDDTAVLLAWLMQTPLRSIVEHIDVKTYKKPTGGPCFVMLSQCHQLKYLRLQKNVALNSQPLKAAKTLFNEAKPLIEALCRRWPLEDAIDMIRFGKSIECFSIKDEDELRAWTPDEKEDFQEMLLEQARHFK